MATDNLNINSNYLTFGQVYKEIQYNDRYSQDYYPRQNVWRGNPMSDNNYIRPNINGYYPFHTEHRPVIKPSPDSADNLTWYYPCSTILSASKDYQTKPYVIQQP
jgi:hypothetical protein